MKNVLVYIFIFLCLACSTDKKPPFQLTENPENLIAGDSSKTWKLAKRFNNNTRMNMGDCFLSYRVTYLANHTMHDNNGEQDDCGETLTANWSLYHSKDNYPFIKLKGEKLKELLGIENDYKFFKILNLNDTLLILEFKHKQYASKATTIIDIMVPEDISIKDRDFHW